MKLALVRIIEVKCFSVKEKILINYKIEIRRVYSLYTAKFDFWFLSWKWMYLFFSVKADNAHFGLHLTIWWMLATSTSLPQLSLSFLVSHPRLFHYLPYLITVFPNVQAVDLEVIFNWNLFLSNHFQIGLPFYRSIDIKTSHFLLPTLIQIIWCTQLLCPIEHELFLFDFVIFF